MFRIKNKEIHITRGDAAEITLKVNNYTFKQGDKIEFRVYKRKELDKEPVLCKTFNIESDSESFNISLLVEDTKLGEMLNYPIEFWYEIELNDKYTVIGYDKDGPKIFMLYPEGAEISE